MGELIKLLYRIVLYCNYVISHPRRDFLEHKSKDFLMLILAIFLEDIFHLFWSFVVHCFIQDLLTLVVRPRRVVTCFSLWFLLSSAGFPHLRGIIPSRPFNNGGKKSEERKSGKPFSFFFRHKPIFCACWRFWRRCSIGEIILLRVQGEPPSIIWHRVGETAWFTMRILEPRSLYILLYLIFFYGYLVRPLDKTQRTSDFKVKIKVRILLLIRGSLVL